MGARRALPALILAAGVTLAACGDDDSGGDPLAAGAGTTARAAEQSGGTTAPPADATGDIPDACGLLTAEEVGQVVPGATTTGPTTSSATGVTTSECAWDSPTGQLTVAVIAGVPPDQLQLSIEAESDDFGGRAVDIGGDDDARVFSAIEAGADVKGVVDGVALTLSMIGDNASSQQDALVDLARTAAGRF